MCRIVAVCCVLCAVCCEIGIYINSSDENQMPKVMLTKIDFQDVLTITIITWQL